MGKKKVLFVVALFVVHAAVTARALLEMSYVELYRFAFVGWPARQIFSDLTVGMLLITGWMIVDAKKTGRTAWPYVAATLVAGSFAPLLYLLVGLRRRTEG